jgi:hypothetical protein
MLYRVSPSSVTDATILLNCAIVFPIDGSTPLLSAEGVGSATSAEKLDKLYGPPRPDRWAELMIQLGPSITLRQLAVLIVKRL